ncbi:hypothetical protein NDI52_28305 [Leptolyngbya sp. PL-A3]|uniref:hypothetical protein n=1 Tax=Leptolyngbya sp. PL-A3 TaxID=2933911 RepID=UPI003296B348
MNSFEPPDSSESGIYITPEFLEQRLKQEQAKDQVLGISRSNIPTMICSLEDSPQARSFCKLVDRIRSVATIHLLPANPEQAAMLRCIQLQWDARAGWLANEIYPQCLTDFPNQVIRPLLPQRAFDNLSLEIPAQMARYQLLRAGEANIHSWCEKEGIDYSFPDALALFVQTLQEEFTQTVEYCFEANPIPQTRATRRQEYRDWLALLTGRDLSKKAKSGDTEAKLKATLRQSGWLGISLLALLSYPGVPHLKAPWKTFIKTHRKLTALVNYEIAWKDGIPRQVGTTSQKIPLKVQITEKGFFDWHF